MEKEILRYEEEKIEFEKEGILYVRENTYKVFTDETKEIACYVEYPKPPDNYVPPLTDKEIAQLDRDEVMLDMALTIEEIKLNQELSMIGGE